MSKSSSKKLSMMDAKYWFKDRCSVGVNGSPLRGPGLICSVYLFLLALGIVSVTGLSIYKLVRNDTYSRLQLTLYTLLSVGWSLIALRFMYSACYICNGIRGFMLLFILGMVVNSVMLLFFGKIVNEMVFAFENKNVN